MKRTISKKIIIALLSALVAVCMGFAVLLSRPAAQANAETLITITIYDGNSGTKIDSAQLDTSLGAQKFPDSLTEKLTAYFGSDESQYYGVQTFDTSSDGSSTWATYETMKNSSFLGNKNVNLFIYTKSIVHIKLLNGSTERGILTVPYTKKINDITLDDLNAVSGVPKSNYILKGFTPNNTDSTFPIAGVRELSLEYTKQTTETPTENEKVTLTFKDGEKVLYTLSVESGKAVNLAEHPEINEAAAKAGYTFRGWSTTKDGALFVKTGYIPGSSSDMTFYALYTEGEAPQKYTVTFKDGNKVLYTIEVDYFDVIVFKDYPDLAKAAEKKGYKLVGWKIGNDVIELGGNASTLNIIKDSTYTAVYEKGGTDPTEPDTPDVPETTEYKVVFLIDNLVAYTATVENGKAVSFADYPELSEKIKKDGYTFKGWKIEGQDELYTDGIPAQNKTTVLVAVFEKNVLGIDGVSKAGSIVLTVAIGIVGVYFLFKLFGGKRRRR
mgnify:FL=1